MAAKTPDLLCFSAFLQPANRILTTALFDSDTQALWLLEEICEAREREPCFQQVGPIYANHAGKAVLEIK